MERRGGGKPNIANKVVIKDHGFKATDSTQNKASRNNYCNFFPDLNLPKGTSFREMAKKKKCTECTTWPFLTYLLKHLGSLKNWHIP